MTVTIQKLGKGLGLTLPPDLVASAGFEAGSSVEVVVQDGRLILTLADATPTLDAMLEQVNPDARPDLAQWGGPVGDEVW